MSIINTLTVDLGCVGSSCAQPDTYTTYDPSASSSSMAPLRTFTPHHGSRRIDMASQINETMVIEPVIHHDDDDDDDDDADLKKTMKNEESEPRMTLCGILCCTPGVCRILWLASCLLILLLLGLGIGFTIRDKRSTSREFSAAMGQDMDSGQIVPAPTMGPVVQTSTAAGGTMPGTVQSLQPSRDDIPKDGPTPEESLSPSSHPTEFFDLNLDEALDEIADDTIEETTEETMNQEFVEWDNSASPYLVGAYYYPWHGKSL